MSTDLTTWTPSQIDFRIAQIEGDVAKQSGIRDRARQRVKHLRTITSTSGAVDVMRINDALRVIGVATLELTHLWDEQTPFVEEFDRRGGWTRYYLVDAHNGHVHHDLSNRRCSRTWGTRHMWLTEQSGMSQEDLVELAGERACTVCFPDAPVEVLTRRSVFVAPCEAEKEARRVEREAKAAKRREKEITNPDGSPLRIKLGGYWETVKTDRSAELRALEIAFDARWQHRPQTGAERAAIAAILAALAAKRGCSVNIEETNHEVRLIKKCQREKIW